MMLSEVKKQFIGTVAKTMKLKRWLSFSNISVEIVGVYAECRSETVFRCTSNKGCYECVCCVLEQSTYIWIISRFSMFEPMSMRYRPSEDSDANNFFSTTYFPHHSQQV